MTVKVPAPETAGDGAGHELIGRLECDAFCACGYNLYRQVVVNDPRLNFPVVRCPECGKWHAAAHGATAASVWLSRLAKVLLLAWVALLLVITAVGVLAQMGLNMLAYEEIFSPRRYGYYGYEEDDADYYWKFTFFLFPLGLGVALGFIQSVTMWHLRSPARLLPPIVVLLMAALLSTMPLQSSYYDQYRESCVLWIVATTGATAIGWVATAGFGRRLARGLARLLIPPGPRQHLAFLWHADGKLPPAANP